MKRHCLLPILLLWFGACAPLPPTVPVPVPPMPPTMHAVRGTITNTLGEGLPTAIVFAIPDNGDSITCAMDPLNSRFLCLIPDVVQHGDINVTNDGYFARRVHVDLVGDLADIVLEALPVLPPPPPPLPILPNLVVRTPRYLGLSTGARFTVIGATDFNLLGRMAAGEDVDAVLSQRESLGFNQVRVFTAYDIGVGSAQPIGRLIPSEHPDLYTRIVPALADAAARHHLYVELVAFTGPYVPGLDLQAHWAGLCLAAQAKTNLVLERINEYNNVPNLGAPDVPRCASVLSSNGSAILDDTPYQPVFEYSTFHPGTGADGYWQRKVGHDAMDISTLLSVPVVANETKRFPDQESNCATAYDAGRSSTLLAAGATYHSVQGKHSDLWTGTELSCATEWARGALSMPLDCQDAGGYVHRIDLENDEVIRAYQRGTDARCIALIRK